ncbi:hypothetical protein LOC67_00125 [Stieleria sp. JC731]|uniref:hypothetical protein n=1 Tax=Pirellulaceae TaxID=2691357 RepID=UPI001E4B32FB|nr:hypothetical protein [Stieleria sp. JC731]MCC9598945.1 hypothetical protein [Stieleria sp. JC731]
MRGLLIAVLVVAALFLIGWLKYDDSNGDPTVRIDSANVRQDTSEMVETTKNAAEEIDRRVDVDIHGENVTY